MTLKLVLFDIDGTLLNSGGVGREAKALAMEDIYGTAGDLRSLHIGGNTDLKLLADALVAHGFRREQLGEMMDAYEQCFAERMLEIIGNYPVRPLIGAHEIVQALRQREDVLLGIVTGNARLTTPIKLRAAGFDPDWFQVAAYGSESADRNDLPQLALQRAQVQGGIDIAPEHIWMIGDTILDIEAARAVGGHAVVVLTGFEDQEALLAAGPDIVLNDLTEFEKLVII